MTRKKRKPATRPPTRAEKPPRIRIDLSEWDTNDWGDDLAKLVKVERHDYGVDITLEFTGSDFERAARKIAQEAVDEFFRDARLTLTDAGFEFCHQCEDAKGAFPLRSVTMDAGIETFEVLRAWMHRELYRYGARDKRGQEAIAAEYAKQGLPRPTFNEDGEAVPVPGFRPGQAVSTEGKEKP